MVMSLWQRGDLNLDEYGGALVENDFYAVECVQPDGAVHEAGAAPCPGHIYSRYPVGGPVIAAPLVLAQMAILRLSQPLLGGVHFSNPTVEAYFHANFGSAHALLEMQAASALLALTAVVLYCTALRYLPPRRAAVLALIFALTTSAYSTAGRALWSHTPSMLLLSVIVYMLLASEERPALAAWAGFPVALSYAVRPTDALFVIVFTAYVAVRHRARFGQYLLAAALPAIGFLTYTLFTYHGRLSPYYQSPLPGWQPANWGTMAEAMAGNLVSPGRGLFVYTPLFLLAVWSMIHGKWKTPLTPWLGALTLAHWFAVSAYTFYWWAGHSYGPRFFTDLTPVFALFLIPYLQNWERMARSARVAFVALVLVGFAMHLRGGWSAAVYLWNTDPVNVDSHPQRVWDWRDPPFLRGLINVRPTTPR